MHAPWSLLLPQFIVFLHKVDVTLHDDIVNATDEEDTQVLINSLSDERFRDVFDESKNCKTSPNTRCGGSILSYCLSCFFKQEL